MARTVLVIHGAGELVGHSFGASVILKYLCEAVPRPSLSGLFLVATPFWGPDFPDFALPPDFAARLRGVSPLFLYHSRDDSVIPVAHLRRFRRALPWAVVRTLDGRGHEFAQQEFPELVDDIRRAVGTKIPKIPDPKSHTNSYSCVAPAIGGTVIARTIRSFPVLNRQVAVLALATSVAAATLGVSGQSSNISVALVGQALIKSDVCATAPAAFEQARGYLKGVDVAFTNLEVAIAPPGHALTPRSAAAVPAPPVVIDCLKAMGFNILSLANNHAFDLQREGIAATIAEVRKRGLVHAGTGADADAAAAPGFLDTPKGAVALVAMATGAQLIDPETWAAPGRPGVNYLERFPDGRPNPQHKTRILDAVRAAARESTLVIAYHHNHYWGDPVGSGLPPDRERRIGRFETLPWAVDWARELIDAGASIYIAHGDPSLHGVEVYKGKLILYGLGNYIFESVGGNDRYGPLAYMSAVATAEFSNGQLVAATFRPLILSTVKVGEAPRGAPYLAEGAEAELILHRLVNQSRRHGVTLEVDTAIQTAHWRPRP